MQACIIEKFLPDDITCLIHRHVLSKQTHQIKADQDIIWTKMEIFNFLDEERRVDSIMWRYTT